MRKVQVYIEGQRLELFDDEQIQVTSSVQNVQDIAKVFTDFSQSFTVPGSEHNNRIFEHFYENAIDGSIDHQLRRSASIEIDLTPFRTGKIQLEKANVKNGRIQSYTITFYGDIRTLQDYFGEDKLNTLDMSPYSHEYTGANIQTRITSSSDYDIRYPLISSSRIWIYGGGGSEDISQNSHHMHYNELFPAIKVSRIFNAIETKYGIDFQGLFLSDKRFTNCFLWLKNKNTFENYTDEKTVDISNLNTGADKYFNTTLDTLYVQYGLEDFGPKKYSVQYKIISVSNSSTWYLDVYKNGSLLTTISNSGTTIGWLGIDVFNITGSNPVIDATYQFKVRASASMDIQVGIALTIEGTEENPGWMPGDPGAPYIIKSVSYISQGTVQSLIGNLNIIQNFPDMKISEFVSGVLKQFNLTCVPTNPTTFQINTLEDWYAQGRLIEATKYIDIDSIDIERVKLYKRIDFKHQPGTTILSREFGDSNFREYGDLQQVYDYDGSEYTIELPFENILHTKFTSTDLQVGYSVDKNLQPVIPKPVLLYMNEQKSCSFYFNNGSTTDQITTYMPFGQDLVYNSVNYTLNFGWDNSSFHLEPIQNNIFMVYYYNYLSNLYSKKQRLLYCKSTLPTSIMTSLKMNDRLIIRNKRYIINEIKSNLTTGEVDLVLLHDFRQIANRRIATTTKGATTASSYIFFNNDAVKKTIDMGSSGVTASETILTESKEVVFTFPTLNPSYTIIAENSDDIITEDTYEFIRSEENNSLIYDFSILTEYINGSTDTETFTLIQDI